MLKTLYLVLEIPSLGLQGCYEPGFPLSLSLPILSLSLSESLTFTTSEKGRNFFQFFQHYNVVGFQLLPKRERERETFSHRERETETFSQREREKEVQKCIHFFPVCNPVMEIHSLHSSHFFFFSISLSIFFLGTSRSYMFLFNYHFPTFFKCPDERTFLSKIK